MSTYITGGTVNRNELSDIILELARNLFKVEVTENTNLINDLNADSLDIVEFMMKLEDKLDIEIDDEELEETKNIKDIVDIINNKFIGTKE